MFDIHELSQVEKEFVPVYKKELDINYNDNLSGKDYFFKVTINGQVYSFNHVLDENNIKAQIKFFTKNDVYDALSDFTGISIPWGSHTGVRPVSLAVKLIKQQDYKYAKEILMRDYRMSKEKVDLCTEVALNQLNLLNINNKAIDVYISIPFCVSRCTYCSFSLIGIEKKKHLHSQYVDALCKEIQAVGKSIIENGYIPRCLYFGGGTPTAIIAELLDKVLATAKEVFPDVKEYTMEAGRADTITEDKLAVIDKYGITRFNINPQTMNDDTLKIIGRNHTVKDVYDTFELVRNHGYSNINMDVIAGLPGETLDDFKHTIDSVLKLKPEDITVHTFALKRASTLKKQDYSIKGNSIADRMLDYSYKRMNEEGYYPYYLYRQKNMEDNGENVGFCKKGYECIYNIDIMEENTHILAMGSGGVSKRVLDNGLVRRSDPKDIEVYIDRIDDTIKNSIEFFS